MKRAIAIVMLMGIVSMIGSLFWSRRVEIYHDDIVSVGELGE